MPSKKNIKTVVLEKVKYHSSKRNICTTDKFNSLGLDSLDKVEVLIDVEEYFNTDLPDNVLDGIDTVEDLINEVEKTLR